MMVISVLPCRNGRSSEKQYNFYDLPFPSRAAVPLMCTAASHFIC